MGVYFLLHLFFGYMFLKMSWKTHKHCSVVITGEYRTYQQFFPFAIPLLLDVSFLKNFPHFFLFLFISSFLPHVFNLCRKLWYTSILINPLRNDHPSPKSKIDVWNSINYWIFFFFKQFLRPNAFLLETSLGGDEVSPSPIKRRTIRIIKTQLGEGWTEMETFLTDEQQSCSVIFVSWSCSSPCPPLTVGIKKKLH